MLINFSDILVIFMQISSGPVLVTDLVICKYL